MTKSSPLQCVPNLRDDRPRQQFIIKTYTLIIMMLCVTMAWTVFLYDSPSMTKWVFSNIWLYYVSLAMVIAISCAMICLYKRCRVFPLNYMLLGVYTLFHAYMVGALCTRYNPETLISAFACTGAMFFGLTTYACFTKTDFTYLGGFICVGTLMLIMFFILFSWFT